MAQTFFAFSQNNTGGEFILDDSFGYTVYVQAKTAKKANKRALKGGIYFGGVADGIDCPCCGDRWYAVFEYSHDPMTLEEVKAEFAKTKDSSYGGHSVIWFKDGEKVVLKPEPKK